MNSSVRCNLAVKILILLSLSFHVGCAKEKRPITVTPGQTTRLELEAQAGIPESVVTLPAAHGKTATLLEYPSRGEIYQSNDHGVVVAATREPDGQEVTLQYWRHRWVGVDQETQEVAGSKDHHGRAWLQLRAPSLNTMVVYDPDRDAVTQVVEYGEAR